MPQESTSFGRIATLYDAARGGYPAALIDHVIQVSGTAATNGRVLDVGCGTGQVTIPFAERGFSVLGIDVSHEMVRLARKKYVAQPNATFAASTFEDVTIPRGSIDIIVSGMAWHWIAPEGRYEKAHQMLKPTGTLALFWSYQDKEASAFVRNVSAVLDKYGGSNRGPAGSRVRDIANDVRHELIERRWGSFIELRLYQEDVTFTRQRYLDIVLSYGWVQVLPEDERNKLMQDITDVLKEQREPFTVPYQHVLVMAKKIDRGIV